MSLIELKEVTKGYKKTNILSDVNLSIKEGDLLGVIGQSGSGKTTLLNLISGFIEPTQGEVTFTVAGKERDLNDHLHEFKKSLGFTPQHNSFYPKLTVLENLIHFGKLYGIKDSILNSNIDSLLKFTKLEKHRHKLAEHLSGGMQKRLDLSCSLVHKPKILVLDEPTADLDPVLQKEILHLLKEVNKQGITIVIASHHLDSVEKLCNKVVIVHKGRVHSHGKMDEVRKPYLQDHFTISVPSEINKEELITKFKKFPIKKIIDKGHSLVVYPNHVEKTINNIIGLVEQEHLQLRSMDMRKMSLSEVFEKIAEE